MKKGDNYQKIEISKAQILMRYFLNSFFFVFLSHGIELFEHAQLSVWVCY